MHACLKGDINDAQLSAFLVLMRMKGEQVEELKAAATSMLQFAKIIDLGDDLIDIVGTGGDGKNTFNISTASSIVAGAAGAKVAKQGNYSVSSSSGCADVLNEAGIGLHLSEKQLQRCLDNTNVCFLLAAHFHPALQQVKSLRQQLGLRSFFNILGPLLNPARVKKQVVGVYPAKWQKPVAEVLAYLGSQRAMVIASQDGLDEVSIAAPTHILELRNNQFHSWILDPRDYHCFHDSLEGILISSSSESLAIIESVFAGKPGPARDSVILNSALALYCAEEVPNLSAGIQAAQQAIDCGKAQACFHQLKEFTKEE